MLSILSNRTYRHLFAAQVVALLGTGLATVALGLLAYDLAGDRAGMVMGTALTIKMVAYVGVAPLAAALAERVDRRRLLVGLDLLRGAAALCLPFVDAVWQVYVLIFVLQSASAGFTPTFQATIPDVLPEERDYTRALSLSRLAYDLESLLSPILAAAALLLVSFDALFVGTALGFAASALLVVSVALPMPKVTQHRSFAQRTTRGIRIYLATPRLRGLLALNLAVSSVGAMVIVNTAVLVRGVLDRPEATVALVLAAYGAGSMLVALALPRLLERVADRPVMLGGAGLATATMALLGLVAAAAGLGLPLLMAAWALIGAGNAAILTPAGRVLKRSSHAQDRPAVFAAQFALSHACWLVTYPLAGLLMTRAGAAPSMLVLAGLGAVGALAAIGLWPRGTEAAIVHSHPDLPDDHPHLQGDGPHCHEIVIDDLHPAWPAPGQRTT